MHTLTRLWSQCTHTRARWYVVHTRAPWFGARTVLRVVGAHTDTPLLLLLLLLLFSNYTSSISSQVQKCCTGLLVRGGEPNENQRPPLALFLRSIYEVYLGNAWRYEGLSFEANFSYLFGNLERSINSVFVDLENPWSTL